MLTAWTPRPINVGAGAGGAKTATLGLAARLTPLTVAVRVLAVPAVVAVNVAVYVPFVAVSTTLLNVPALVPPDRPRPKALLFRPLTALPAPSLTTMVIRSVPPAVTVGDAKLTVEPVPL